MRQKETKNRKEQCKRKMMMQEKVDKPAGIVEISKILQYMEELGKDYFRNVLHKIVKKLEWHLH